MMRIFTLLAVVVGLGMFAPAMAAGPSSSLFGAPDERRPLTLADNSWYFIDVEPPPQIELYDLVTVIVAHASQAASEGSVFRNQRSKIDAALQDWVSLENFSLKPAVQADGDPKIKAQLNSQLQTDMELESLETMKFSIAARVVDIRPNGNLVLEAHQTFNQNSEVWEASLSGECRAEDVLPNNSVLHKNIYDLRIVKREKGHVRDAYRRGWVIKLLDAVKPF